MRKINAKAAHKRLWQWLADNPGKEKRDWLEWEWNGGNIPFVHQYCFACAVSLTNKADFNDRSACGSGRCPLGDCQPEFSWWGESNRVNIDTEVRRHALNLANKEWDGPTYLYFDEE